MIATVTNHISKGCINLTTPANRAWWYKTNFNMPIRNYMSPNMTFVRHQGAWTYQDEGVAYNLAGFVPGFEICNGCAIFDFENDSLVPYNINTRLYVGYMNPALAVIFYVCNGYNVVETVAPGYWTEYWWGGNIGCCAWEVTSSSFYRFFARATGTPSIPQVETIISMSNVPSTAELAAGTEGYIWVEGNNLCYICANRWKHTMVGTDEGLAGITYAGAMWIDNANVLHWVGANGHKYRANWQVKQFASFYFNSADHVQFAGLDKEGYLWVDNEFGETHLAYIGHDGYKYLTGAGVDPYI
jgi:hypothetical protein